MGIGEEQMPEDKAGFRFVGFPAGKTGRTERHDLKAGNAVKSVLNDGVSKTMAIFNA